jgi:hypothetical protein
MTYKNDIMNALTEANNVIELPELLTVEILVRYFKSKYFWKNLEKMFSNYFSGKPVFEDVEANDTNNLVLSNVFDYYLNFYNLIALAWYEIQPELSMIFDSLKLESPGDVLIYVMSNEAKRWTEIKPLAEPQTLYKACHAVSSKNSFAAEKWLRRVEKQTGRTRNIIPNSEHIIHLCVQIGIVSKNKSFREKAMTMESCADRRHQNILKHLRKQFR